jgi:transcriptional regulator with XRE-family HTH domain
VNPKLTATELGPRIDAACERAGITPTKLAKACDVTFAAAYRWRKGVAVPRVGHLTRIAELCGITVDELCSATPLEPAPATDEVDIVAAATAWADEAECNYALFEEGDPAALKWVRDLVAEVERLRRERR